MKPARRSIASVITLLVMLAAYLVSTTAAVAHIHLHPDGHRHAAEVKGGGLPTGLHDDGGCALCDHGPLLALPGVAALAADPAPFHVEHAVELRTAPPCADRSVTTLRGPPALL